MELLDNEFFEAYKRLDKLCREIFDCKNGVSEYILQMENTPNGRNKIASWDSDYKALKHLRWLRNQIAHDTTENSISKQEDILWAESFYNRIIEQEDPFSQLRKMECRKKEQTLPNIRSNEETGDLKDYDNNQHLFSESKHGKNDYFVVILFIVVTTLLLYFMTLR